MNLPSALYLIIGSVLVFLGSAYFGYRLTRRTLFTTIMDPAIREAYNRGYSKGLCAGKELERARIAEAMEIVAEPPGVDRSVYDMAQIRKQFDWNEEPQPLDGDE